MKMAFQGPKHGSAFRDKYLAAVISVAALLLNDSIIAQTAPSRNGLNIVNTIGNNNRNGAYRGVLYIPEDTVSTSDSGAIAYLAGKFYLKNSTHWSPLGTALQISDSSFVVGQDTIKIRSIYSAVNGLTRSNDTIKLGGSLTELTTLTGISNNHRIVLNTPSSIGEAAFKATVTSSNSYGLWGVSDRGTGVQGTSLYYTGVFGYGGYRGVDATVIGGNGYGVSGNAYDTTSYAIQGYVAPTNSGSGNKIVPVAVFTRNSGVTVSNGMGARLDFSFPNYSSGGIPNDFRSMGTLDLQMKNIFGSKQNSEWHLSGVADSILSTILTLNGKGWLQLNKYGTGANSGTPVYNLAVDATGKVIETSGAIGSLSTASNGLSAVGTDIQLGGPLTKTTSITGSTSTQRLEVVGVGDATNGVLKVASSGGFAPALAVNATGSSANGINATSSNGIGVSGTGFPGGFFLNGGSNTAAARVVSLDTTSIPLQIESLGTVPGTGNKVISGIRLYRNQGGAGNPIANGIGTGITVNLPSYPAVGQPSSFRDFGQIDMTLPSYRGPGQNSEWHFWGVGDSSYNRVLTLNGLGWASFDAYTSAGNMVVNDVTNYKPAVFDANGKLFRMADWPGGGGGTNTFSNGLTESSGVVKLGGSLTQNTIIDGSSSYATDFTSSATNTVTIENTGSGKALNVSSFGGTGIYATSLLASPFYSEITNSTGVSPAYYAKTVEFSGSDGFNANILGNGHGFSAVTTAGEGLYLIHKPFTYNDITTVASFYRQTSGNGGNGANGIGVKLGFGAPTTNNTSPVEGGSINWQWTDANNSSRTGQFNFKLANNAGTPSDKFIIKGSGQLQAPAYGSSNFASGTPVNSLYVDAGGNLIEKPVPLKFSQTSNVVVSGTTSETSIVGAGTGTLTIPANSLVVGKTYRVKIYLVYSTDGSNPSGITLRLKLGGTTIANTGSSFLGAGKSNVQYTGDAEIVCRSTGSSGTVMVMGTRMNDGNVGVWSNGSNTSTINTTTSNTLDITVQLSDSSVGNVVTAYQVIFEEVN